jgi:GWxTD domain-containing protein
MPWRIGHEVGFTADAASFPDSSGNILEVYFRIRPSLIADLCRAGRDPAPVRVIAKLRSVFGGKTQEREQIFQVNPADTTGTLGEVVVLSFPTKPGSHHLELRLETRRRQLARMGMEKPEAAKISGDIEVPAPQAGREISDLQFVLGDADRQLSHVFGRSGHDLLPNPERLYGLYATDLRALFTARGASEEPRPWHWVARILGTGGQVYALQESSEVAARTIASEIRLDVSTLPAGPYDLEVKAWQEGDAGAVLRRSRFTVGWQVGTWRRDPLDIADDAHFLLKNDDEEDRFEKLPAGEQEAILDTFWLQRDPTPETGENEARTMYLKRVDYANRMYGRYGIGRGMFSDMGRTFIRYGEPNEVYRQVMPALDDNLVNLVTQLARAETRQLGSNLEKPEVGGDMRPFELWLYEGDIPLPIDADPKLDSGHATRRRLVFLFVDQNWLGDYRLLYSSE